MSPRRLIAAILAALCAVGTLAVVRVDREPTPTGGSSNQPGSAVDAADDGSNPARNHFKPRR